MKKINLLICILGFIFLFINIVLADVVNKITINGNIRIQKETILEYSKIELNKNYSSIELNDIQKNIFNTNFFEKVTITLENKTLIIDVVENPLVNFFNIQGEKSSETTNKFYDTLSLGPNKIYTEYNLKSDLDLIKNYYLNKGYENIEVTPRISKLSDNKINILINIVKDEQTAINRIHFIGDKKFDTSELLSVITTSEYSWWKFLSTTTPSGDRIEYDKSKLKKFYLDNGYYDIQITSVELKKISKYRSDLIFSINAGAKYNFGVFNISGDQNLLNENTKKFINNMKNKFLSNVFSQSNQINFVKQVNEFISKEKIEFVEVNLNEKKNNNKIDIDLNIKLSNKNYINRVNITGNDITNEEVIRRNLYFSEGDSYLDYKVKASEDNLRSTQIFKKITISKNQLQDNKVDVNVNVVEQPTGSLTASAGYGTDGGTIGFGVNEKNFLGKGINATTNLNIGTQKIEGKLSLTIPDFNYSEKDLYTSVYSLKTNYQNTLYESKKTGLDLGTRYEIYDKIYFKPGFGLDYETIDVNSSASNYLKTQDGSFSSQRINYGIENDNRDTKYQSKRGYLIGMQQEYATLFSDVQYISSSIYAANYFPLTEKENLKIQYGFSNIFSTNNKDLKLSNRIFIPHQYSKGFEPRGFGPKDSSSGNYIGGNNSAYSTLTSSFPNPLRDTSNLNTYAFISAFNLWGTDNSLSTDSNSLRSSYGIGIEWKSPLGPVNVNFADTIKKKETDKTQFFSFDIGTIF